MPKSDSNLVNKPKPLLTFEPNETQFHLSLVEGMEANIVIRYLDGSESNKTWRPTRYTQGSNLRGNIWSGFLRGWKDQDIISAKFCAGNEPTQ